MQANPVSNRPYDDLLSIFETALTNAKPYLESAKSESLFQVANSAYTAFQDAKDAIIVAGKLPFVAGSDPHYHEPCANPQLGVALNSVYGFGNENYSKVSPKSVAAMDALKPVASAMHARGYCIFT